MANIVESSVWESGIYCIGISDPVQGGTGGISNISPGQLANRTKKIYDVLSEYGIFINPSEQDFVGQHSILEASFAGSVVDGNIVYYNNTNNQFENALVTGGDEEKAVGIADKTNSKVITTGLVQTSRSDPDGTILYLSSSVAGALTTTNTGIAVGRYLYDGIIFLSPSDAAIASAAILPPNSVTPLELSESYYTESESDAKFGGLNAANTWNQQNNFSNNVLINGTLGYSGTVLTVSPDQLNSLSVIVANASVINQTYADLTHTFQSGYKYKLYYRLFDFSQINSGLYILFNGVQNIGNCIGSVSLPGGGDGSSGLTEVDGYGLLSYSGEDNNSICGWCEIMPRDNTSNTKFSYFSRSVLHDETSNKSLYHETYGWWNIATTSLRIQLQSSISPTYTFSGKIWLERSAIDF